MFQLVTGLSAAVGGVVTGLVMMLRNINIVPCLKSPTIAAVITFWLHIVASADVIAVGFGGSADVTAAFYAVYFIVIDPGSIVFMMFKLPADADRRQKLVIFFANPVLYSLINTLMKTFSNFLEELHLLG